MVEVRNGKSEVYYFFGGDWVIVERFFKKNFIGLVYVKCGSSKIGGVSLCVKCICYVFKFFYF